MEPNYKSGFCLLNSPHGSPLPGGKSYSPVRSLPVSFISFLATPPLSPNTYTTHMLLSSPPELPTPGG